MNNERTALFLMANLGSEVSRLYARKRKGDTDLIEASYRRAKEILAEVMKKPEMTLRKQELLILEDVFDDVLRDKPKYMVSEDELEEYFLPIAISFAGKIQAGGK